MRLKEGIWVCKGLVPFHVGMTSPKSLAKVTCIIVKSLLMQCDVIYGNMLYNSKNHKHNGVDRKPSHESTTRNDSFIGVTKAKLLHHGVGYRTV